MNATSMNCFFRSGVRAALPTLFAMLLLAIIAIQPAHAQLEFLLQPNVQVGTPGSLLTYSATLTNLGSDELFLNGTFYTLSGSNLTLDDTPFLVNFPLSLLAGESYTDDLFTVTLDPAVQSGDYLGSFSILGGTTDDVYDDLATQNFLVSVPSSTAAPEPGSLALIALATLPVAGLVRRQKRFSADAGAE